MRILILGSRVTNVEWLSRHGTPTAHRAGETLCMNRGALVGERSWDEVLVNGYKLKELLAGQ